MNRRTWLVGVAGSLLLASCTQRMRTPATQPAAASDRATLLAEQVVMASGGRHWPKVSRVQFTFNVEQDGKTVASRKHDWNVKEGTDTVTVGDKTTTVNVRQGPPAGDEAAKQAYQQWTNDSYWLLAPLKLRDPGVNLAYVGTRDVAGKTYEVIQSSYDNVGLTSNDRYNFYIDPKSHLVERWDYMPTPEKMNQGTWENYKDFNGLKLATNHQFGARRIYFTDVVVTK